LTRAPDYRAQITQREAACMGGGLRVHLNCLINAASSLDQPRFVVMLIPNNLISKGGAMTSHELTRDQLIEIIGKYMAGGAKVSPEQIARDYQVSQDYSERIARLLNTPVTKISGSDIPPVTEPFPKTMEEAFKSALWEKGYKLAPGFDI